MSRWCNPFACTYICNKISLLCWIVWLFDLFCSNTNLAAYNARMVNGPTQSAMYNGKQIHAPVDSNKLDTGQTKISTKFCNEQTCLAAENSWLRNLQQLRDQCCAASSSSTELYDFSSATKKKNNQKRAEVVLKCLSQLPCIFCQNVQENFVWNGHKLAWFALEKIIQKRCRSTCAICRSGSPRVGANKLEFRWSR